MAIQTGFVVHTAETAPEGSRPFLVGAKEQFGFVPTPMAKMASSPVVLESFLSNLPIFEKSSLSPIEREVVIMAVAVHNGCHYCVPMHTAILKRMDAPEDLINALRDGTRIGNPKLQALAEFTRRVLQTRGHAGETAVSAFYDAGFNQQNALDVVLGVSVFTLTTYAIALTEPKLDPAFEPFKWTPPAGK
ncbi:carboxymuconolactone decarboxylase family protein [Pendulispora brunnea]|uniref:Carboxymuconolactone decarboxylase family protein n=1 Tax=Pendulispora brunnea TaxID=2905690 RepID=A0ABZ2KCP4_9BACT